MICIYVEDRDIYMSSIDNKIQDLVFQFIALFIHQVYNIFKGDKCVT